MKQSRLFPLVLVSFIIIVSIGLSRLSAAVTSWDDIDYSAGGYYKALHYRENNAVIQTLDTDDFGSYKISRMINSIQLFWNPGEIYGQDLFPDMFINETFNAMPNEFLTLLFNSQPLISKQPSERGNDVQPSEPADYIVFDSNADYIKSMRVPAPTSLLLVAIGLLSLRYTRLLRL